jgi:deazaflavin-dependent oxidoreductase (nitroreductase family)
MVATAKAATRTAPSRARARRANRHDFGSRFYRTLNRFVEPVAEAGCFSPEFWPTGLILLETTGRNSGKPHRTPVLAMLMDGHLIVRTFRGERSQWFQNLRANPEVAYWSGGERRRAHAKVHAPGEHCSTESLPPFAAAAVAAAGLAVQLMGWRFAVLVPEAAAGS